jgi:hypothetical protein
VICGRCDKPIEAGEQTVEADDVQGTGARPPTVIHARLCRRVQIQTTPHYKW